jgi:RimJ/RimL family protein N-acetyltransferase
MYALRELEREDVKTINAWRRDPELIRHLGAPYRFIGPEVDERWFDAYLQKRGSTIRCAVVEREKPEEILGLVTLADIDWVHRGCELHIMIGPAARRGKGAGSFAVEAMLRHAFADMGLERVQVLLLEDNTAALGLYRKCGFQEEGLLRRAAYKEGVWRNMRVMSVLREEWNEREH